MTDSSDLLPVLREGLARALRQPAPAIAADTPLTALGLDSVGVLELVGHVEETFAIEIRDDDLAGLHTIGDLDALVTRVRAGA